MLVAVVSAALSGFPGLLMMLVFIMHFFGRLNVLLTSKTQRACRGDAAQAINRRVSRGEGEQVGVVVGVQLVLQVEKKCPQVGKTRESSTLFSEVRSLTLTRLVLH